DKFFEHTCNSSRFLPVFRERQGILGRGPCPGNFGAPEVLLILRTKEPPLSAKNSAPGARLGTTIANSLDPPHPPFWLSSGAFHFPKVDRYRMDWSAFGEHLTHPPSTP